jgi:hypothetical protein
MTDPRPTPPPSTNSALDYILIGALLMLEVVLLVWAILSAL